MDKSLLALGCDHAGVQLKNVLTKFLDELGISWEDFGTNNEISVDYPDYAKEVVNAILSGKCKKGILICGTGIGMSISANRFKGIRAALCHDAFTAKMSRKHNDANILVIGAGVTAAPAARDMLETWLNESFEGGRHERRICKIEYKD